MTTPLVYLAGPIAGCSYGRAMAWRVAVRENLELMGYDLRTLSPMRAKEGLREERQIRVDQRNYADLGPFYTARGIMARDFTDVKRSDALLVNLYGCGKMTTGTVMELGWAYALQKPVVAWIEPEGNIHDTHPMVKEAIGGLRFDDLDAAIHATAVLLGV